ncbi:MAG: hypothetical protein HQM09_17585 [Candidatus Riflebacteria bacterium]|nr:hypothetical protein [Candidatus Riflebacteria bacterium]
MPIPIQYITPESSARSFQIVTHIEPYEVKFLVQKRFGCQFWAKDEDALSKEHCRDNIEKLYDLMKIPNSTKFVSAFVKSRDFSCDFAGNFGSICLFLDIEKIKDETIIFNGDVKNLAYKLSTQKNRPKNRFLRFHSLTERHFDILIALQRYYWNKMAWAVQKKAYYPRMIGCYFEARVFRPIVSKDIKMIVIPKELEPKEKKNVERLANSI